MSNKAIFVTGTISGPINEDDVPTMLQMEFGAENITSARFNWGRQSTVEVLEVYIKSAEREFSQDFKGDTLTIAGAIPRYVLEELTALKRVNPVPSKLMVDAVQVAFLPFMGDNTDKFNYHPLVFPLAMSA